jgi:hypothetical protein
MKKTSFLFSIAVVFWAFSQFGCDTASKSNGDTATFGEESPGLEIETGVPMETGDMHEGHSSEGEASDQGSENPAASTSNTDSDSSASNTENGAGEGPILQPPQNAESADK